jgi:5-methyltetrahydrofolate--homocysteine methyltransferase
MGTELIARGLDVRADIAERWVLERSDQVSAIHAAYAASGAEVIQTCTFGALAARLAPKGLANRQAEIISRAIDLAQAAAPDLPVIASLGPSGLVKDPEHANDPSLQQQLAEDYGRAAQAMSGRDLAAIHLETQLTPGELRTAVSAIRASAGDLPLWVSITVIFGSGGLETPLGVPISKMIQSLRDASPDAVGVNCSLDGDRIRHAVEALVAANLGPVVARPQPRISEKCANGLSREAPEHFAQRALGLLEAGATAVGGCCGTTPATIAALAQACTRKVSGSPVTRAKEVAR